MLWMGRALSRCLGTLDAVGLHLASRLARLAHGQRRALAAAQQRHFPGQKGIPPPPPIVAGRVGIIGGMEGTATAAAPAFVLDPSGFHQGPPPNPLQGLAPNSLPARAFLFEARGATRPPTRIDVAAAELRRARELRRAGLLADEDHGILVGAILATTGMCVSHMPVGKREDRATQETGGVLRPEARRHDRPEVPDRDRH